MFSRGLLLAFFTCASVASCDFRFIFSQQEWAELGSPTAWNSDFIATTSGERLWGDIVSVPDLHYSFGVVHFEPAEVAGLSFASDSFPPKCQIITRNGQNFIGSFGNQLLCFEVNGQVRKFSPNELNCVLLKKRGPNPPCIDDSFWSLILENGDRFAVLVDTKQVHVSRGVESFSVPVAEIVDLEIDWGVHGQLKGRSCPEKLENVCVSDTHLKVRLAKDNKPYVLPWAEIRSIQSDMGAFCLTTPYYFSKSSPDDMVCIPAGEFWLGTNQSYTEAKAPCTYNNVSKSTAAQMLLNLNLVPTVESPSVRIDCPQIWVDRFEVTNSDYGEFLRHHSERAIPAHWQGGWYSAAQANLPVVNVSFADAAAFAAWAGKRLPTEIEWERIAKFISGYQYSYGDQYDVKKANTDSKGLKPVGSYLGAIDKTSKRNYQQQVADMTGNVAEWTTTPWSAHWYEQLAKASKGGVVKNPKEPDTNEFKVVRGGSFASSEKSARTTARAPMKQIDCNERTGFRCVKETK